MNGEGGSTMLLTGNEQERNAINKRWFYIILISVVLGGALAVGALAGYAVSAKEWNSLLIAVVFAPLVPLAAYLLYRGTIYPSYRRLEDANLELHFKQEELLDTKDDLFIKFLGIYDVNYAANSPRLFQQRLRDVADITTRVMEADQCLIFLYEKKSDELTLVAANEALAGALGKARLPLGTGIEGWVGRRLEPVMLKDLQKDPRRKDLPGVDLSAYQSAYCLPLYVYSNGALMGVIEVLYRKPKAFRDEEINFFTTLSGILATTMQNELMQNELRKMNMELEQWVTEKTEEFRASEERYRTLVENSGEAILLLAENGDIVFANDQAASLTGLKKYDLIHRTLSDIVIPSGGDAGALLRTAVSGSRVQMKGDLKRTDNELIPVEVYAAGLQLIGRRFVQCMMRDLAYQRKLEQLLEEKERQIAALKKAGGTAS